MTGKCLILGLDGATFDLIKPWAAAGDLPELHRLMRDGAYATLNAFPNTNSAAAWTNIVTGCNPARHSILDFGTRPLPEQTDWQPTTALNRRRPPFWHMLNQAGRKTGIVNVPITYPADPVDGFMISGMDAPDMSAPGAAHPPDLLRKIRASGIEYIQDITTLKDERARNGDRLPPSVAAMINARADTALHLMRSYAWDALMVVFIATDRVQHIYWGQGDPAQHPSWNVVRETYRLLDKRIGDIIAAAGPDTTTLILSDHGFGSNVSLTKTLRAQLLQMGILRLKQSHTNRSSSHAGLLAALLQTGRKLLPQSRQPTLARWLPGLHRRAVHDEVYGSVDWAHTLAFPYGAGTRFYLNLQGRQPEGIVSPDDYATVCAELQAKLVLATDPHTGERLIRRVWLRDELYKGDFIDDVADLHLEWDFDALERSMAARQATGAHTALSGPQTGTHRPDGIFIAHGPSIRPGTKFAPMSHYDLVPTLLYQQGLPVPQDLDGRVLTEIFDDETLRDYPVQTGEAQSFQAGGAGQLDASAAKQIENRLRDLGYI